MQHGMIWTVIGKMFIIQSCTKSKAVINGKNGTNIWMDISAEIYYIKKSIRYDMQHLLQIA